MFDRFDPRDRDRDSREDHGIYDSRRNEPRDRDEDERHRERDAIGTRPTTSEISSNGFNLPRGLCARLYGRAGSHPSFGEDSRTLATVGAFRVVSRVTYAIRRDDGRDTWEGSDLIGKRPRRRERVRTLRREGSGPRRHRDRDDDRRQDHAGEPVCTRTTRRCDGAHACRERLQEGADIRRVSWRTISSASTRSGSRSTTAAVRTVTDDRTGTRAKSRNGRATTTCRTSTSRSIFPISAWSTNSMGDTVTKTSRWSRTITAAAMPPAARALDSRVTPVADVAADARSIRAWRRTSYEPLRTFAPV